MARTCRNARRQCRREDPGSSCRAPAGDRTSISHCRAIIYLARERNSSPGRQPGRLRVPAKAQELIRRMSWAHLLSGGAKGIVRELKNNGTRSQSPWPISRWRGRWGLGEPSNLEGLRGRPHDEDHCHRLPGRTHDPKSGDTCFLVRERERPQIVQLNETPTRRSSGRGTRCGKRFPGTRHRRLCCGTETRSTKELSGSAGHHRRPEHRQRARKPVAERVQGAADRDDSPGAPGPRDRH